MHIEYAIKQLNKQGEELCGDNIGIVKNPNNTIFILSDGLGSGVKANILSTMTKQIALTMLSNEMSIEDVVETLAQTLPVCKVRNIAYSTFSIVQIFDDQRVKIVEFDNPSSFYIKNNFLCPIQYKEIKIADKLVKIAEFHIQEGDYLILVSDGVINAGLGSMTKFGWGWENIGAFVQKNIFPQTDSEVITETIGYITNKLYQGQIGDDTSILVIKAREKRNLIVAIGPPEDKLRDRELVRQVVNFPGRKIICGGTTSNIFSRILNKKLNVKFEPYLEPIPPKGEMQGFDLITEGVITLSKAIEALKENLSSIEVLKKNSYSIKSMYQKTDPVEELLNNIVIIKVLREGNPALELAKEFEQADSIRFIVGTAVNPAYQELNLPIESKFKMKLVLDIAEKMKEKNKEVEIVYF